MMEPPGAIGLIAPFPTDVAPILMPLVTVGRAVVVTCAVVTHVRRKEPATVQRGLGLLAVPTAPLILWSCSEPSCSRAAPAKDCDIVGVAAARAERADVRCSALCTSFHH